MVVYLCAAKGDSKYSKEKRGLKEETVLRDIALDKIQKSSGLAKFRTAKLAAVWEKAQKVSQSSFQLNTIFVLW